MMKICDKVRYKSENLENSIRSGYKFSNRQVKRTFLDLSDTFLVTVTRLMPEIFVDFGCFEMAALSWRA